MYAAYATPEFSPQVLVKQGAHTALPATRLLLLLPVYGNRRVSNLFVAGVDWIIMESPSGSRRRVPEWKEGLAMIYEPAERKANVKEAPSAAVTLLRLLILFNSVIFVHGLQGHPKDI